jgi:hypothetical protein
MTKPNALQLLDQRAQEREQAAEKRKSRPVPTQLSLWPERVRGLPNMLARCALFTAAGHKEERREFNKDTIFSVEGFTMKYSGPELRQDDQDVFLQLVHMTRSLQPGEKLNVSGYAILQALGWDTGGREYKRLREHIDRMADGKLDIVGTIGGEPFHFKGGLLPSMLTIGAHARTRFSLWIDPSVIALFGEEQYTLIDWADRLELGPLAKWLHSFYFTHRKPFAYRVETLHKLCGSRTKELRSFKKALAKTLEGLKASGFLEYVKIDGDLVLVRRAPVKEVQAAA